jgi:hypothetical protein
MLTTSRHPAAATLQKYRIVFGTQTESDQPLSNANKGKKKFREKINTLK